MSLESWLIGIVCALVGGATGHFFARKVYNQKVGSLQNAMIDEFQFLQVEMERWLPKLLNEYEQPIQDIYSAIPALDLSLVDSIVIELVSTEHRVTKEQRKFIIRLKLLLAHAEEIDSQRGILIKRLFEAENVMDFEEKRNIGNRISFLTALLLVDVIETIFYVLKLSEEKNNFEINGIHTHRDYADVACKQAKIIMRPDIWQRIFMNTAIDE